MESFQVEKFLEILNVLNNENNLSMVELGSNDAYYTIIFNKFLMIRQKQIYV